jgi:formate dehydrogenase major subunit
VWWNGKAWGGTDVPDFKADVPPEAGMNPFIMNPEGVARFFAVDKMNEGLPRALRAVRNAHRHQPAAPGQQESHQQPGGADLRFGVGSLGVAEGFPYAATTYRLTEHFHFWSKHCKLNAIAQPEQFVEIGEVLAKEKGIAAGDRVRQLRGHIEAVAVVTKRIRPLQVNNQVVHQIGIPLHWGSPARRATVT